MKNAEGVATPPTSTPPSPCPPLNFLMNTLPTLREHRELTRNRRVTCYAPWPLASIAKGRYVRIEWNEVPSELGGPGIAKAAPDSGIEQGESAGMPLFRLCQSHCNSQATLVSDQVRDPLIPCTGLGSWFRTRFRLHLGFAFCAVCHPTILHHVTSRMTLH